MAPFVAPETTPDAAIDDVVDDGLIIAVAGVRMTVRNLMIVRALRDNADYDEAWYLDATRAQLLLLAAEKRADAARVADYLTAASDRYGRPESSADYRSDDAATLERREAALLALAVRLEALGDAEAGAIVDDARAAALDDIANAIRSSSEPSAEYGAARPERIDQLTADIAMLQLRRSGL